MATPALLSRDNFFAASEAGDVTTVERFFTQSTTLQAALALEARITDAHLIEYAGQELIRANQTVVPFGAWVYRSSRYDFVFRVAIARHQYDVIEWLYTSPLAPFLRRTLQFYLLDTAVAAILRNEDHILELLLESQAWIEYPDEARPKFFSTVIRCGIDWERSTILRTLAAHGADCNGQVDDFGCPLRHAAFYDPSGAMAYDLRDQGSFTVGEGTALLRAAENGYQEAIRVLLDVGVDPHARDQSGNTPLHHAAREGYHEAVAMLLKCACVDVDAKNAAGDTPLTATIRQNTYSNDDEEPPTEEDEVRNPRMNRPRVIDILLDAGADPNVFVPDGGDHRTPLHVAVEALSVDAVRRLCARGVDPNVRSPVRRETPAHLLSESIDMSMEIYEILRLLVDHGADVRCVDVDGKTAMDRMKEKPWWRGGESVSEGENN